MPDFFVLFYYGSPEFHFQLFLATNDTTQTKTPHLKSKSRPSLPIFYRQTSTSLPWDLHDDRSQHLTPPPQKRIKSIDLYRAQHGLSPTDPSLVENLPKDHPLQTHLHRRHRSRPSRDHSRASRDRNRTSRETSRDHSQDHSRDHSRDFSHDRDRSRDSIVRETNISQQQRPESDSLLGQALEGSNTQLAQPSTVRKDNNSTHHIQRKTHIHTKIRTHSNLTSLTQPNTNKRHLTIKFCNRPFSPHESLLLLLFTLLPLRFLVITHTHTHIHTLTETSSTAEPLTADDSPTTTSTDPPRSGHPTGTERRRRFE